MDARNTSGLIITTPTDREIVLTRSFSAPRGLVFEAWTTPEHVRRWWGCDKAAMTVCEIDLRVGGSWRYVLSADGEEHGFHGVYREVVAPARLVHTYIYEPMPQHGALNTVLFEERGGGRTTVIETVLHQTREARDGHLQSGMEGGATESMNRLEAYLETMKS